MNEDPIIIVNGLTKNWRLPGFRICWVVGPKKICEMLSSAGSFLDGGANAPLQKLALPLMDMDFIRRDTWALQRHFKMVSFLLDIVIKFSLYVQSVEFSHQDNRSETFSCVNWPTLASQSNGSQHQRSTFGQTFRLCPNRWVS